MSSWRAGTPAVIRGGGKDPEREAESARQRCYEEIGSAVAALRQVAEDAAAAVAELREAAKELRAAARAARKKKGVASDQ